MEDRSLSSIKYEERRCVFGDVRRKFYLTLKGAQQLKAQLVPWASWSLSFVVT